MVACADPAELERLAEELAPDVAKALLGAARIADPSRVAAATGVRAHPTGVWAVAPRIPYTLKDILDAEGPAVLLEEPRHPGNVGACVRVAAAAGAAGVLVLGGADPWSPAAIRGAAGLQFAVPVARVDSLPETTRPVAALDPDGEDLGTAEVPDDAILAFGTERDGLSADMLARADLSVRIPMEPGVSSLNLAVAVGVALFACRA